MLKLNIQLFADGKVVIDTELNTKNFENGLSKMKSTTKNAGTSIKNIIAGLGITKLISAAFSTINASLDGAISRIDTMNNFPRVMSNLGIGAEEADKSIKKLSEKLQGLPTTLDSAASSVQRLTSSNGDIEKSTNLFLGLNNAILAGGASSEIQASALEQLSQAYAKGKPDMMEWRTAMTAMPAQLKQVAEAMGYISADELGEALRNGTVSMDEFMETISKLNTEGVNGFQSFEEQAKNATGGIQTAITNAKTAVTRGVASMVTSFDELLKSNGLGSLASVISTIGGAFEKLMKGEALDTKKVTEFSQNFINTIVDLAQKIIEALPEIAQTIADMLPVLLPQLIEGAISIINSLAQTLPTLIPILVTAILDGLLSILDNMDQMMDAGISLIMGVADGLIQAIPILVEKAPIIIEKLIDNFAENAPKLLAVAPKLILSLWRGLIENFPSLLKKIPSLVASIVNSFIKYAKNMISVGKDLIKGIWNGIKDAKQWLFDKIKGFGKSVVNKIKDVFGIHSPSTVMRDMIGKNLAEGIGVGFEEGIDDVYKSMQHAINLEQAKLQANVETGSVFNTLNNSTPIQINVNADVEMDSTKVGRLITPVISDTLKTGGIR